MFTNYNTLDVLSYLGNRMVDLADLVTAIDSVAEVFICQLLPRVRVRPTGRRSRPTRADFNAVRFVFNLVIYIRGAAIFVAGLY